MTGNKQFKLHIEWYNQEKTEGEFVLKDGGQPLGVIESIEDARLIRDTLNELCDEIGELKQEVELLRFGLNKYESLLPQYLTCGEINGFHSDLFEFQIKQLKFYKEHPNLVKQVTIVNGERIDD